MSRPGARARSRTHPLVLGLAALGALSLAAPRRAAAVTITLVQAPRVAFTDQPLQVAVDLTNLTEDVTQIELKADPALRVGQPQSGGRRTEIVNGVRHDSVRVFWRISPPGRRGTYRLGPVTLTTASGKHASQAVGVLRVVQRAPAGTAKLLVHVAPTRGPVGFPFRVTYTILTAEKRYDGGGGNDPLGAFDLFGGNQTPYGLAGLSLALFQGDLPIQPLKADPALPATKVSLGNKRTLLVQDGIREVGGLGYHATTFALKVTPRRPGPIDLSAQATVKVVSGSRLVRGFFGQVQRVQASATHKLDTGKATYQVAPLPTAGQPDGFTGAIGHYTVRASVATPEANAYDPITVTITVKGDGLLDDVSLPPWQDMPRITRDFQVASDVDPGKIQGDTKTFTKVFRARSGKVKELPALPFPYFDPRTRTYRVAHTQPIPLTIHDVKTVTAADAVGGSQAAAQPQGGGAAPLTPIAARDGIQANYLSLGDQVPLLAPPAHLDLLLLVVFAAPPVVLLGAAGLRRLRARVPTGPSPLQRAQRDLRAAGAGEGALDGVRAALTAYFQARLGLAGEVTPAELEQALRARVVPPASVDRAVALWRELDRARFAGGAGAPPGAEEVLREVDPCL